MTDRTAPPRAPTWSRARLAALAAAGAALALFAAANAHLLAVSFASQPDCVAHLKAPLEAPLDGGAAYRAAKPSC